MRGSCFAIQLNFGHSMLWTFLLANESTQLLGREGATSGTAFSRSERFHEQDFFFTLKTSIKMDNRKLRHPVNPLDANEEACTFNLISIPRILKVPVHQ